MQSLLKPHSENRKSDAEAMLLDRFIFFTKRLGRARFNPKLNSALLVLKQSIIDFVLECRNDRKKSRGCNPASVFR